MKRENSSKWLIIDIYALSHLEERTVGKVKELKGKERRKVNQQLHIIANQLIEYVKQFPKPVIVMENLNNIRSNFKKSKKLNKHFHSLPFRKLQTIIEYKANLESIPVMYINPKTLLKNVIDVGMLPE